MNKYMEWNGMGMMLSLTPGQQQTLAQRPAVIACGPVKAERRAEVVSSDGHPELGGQREEMNKCRDDDARVDPTQPVSVVGEQQTQVVG